MNNKTIIKVLIADDHPVFREGLKLLLETSGEIKIVGEAENGRQAVQLAKTLRPDVAILDVAMPLLNGLEAARQIVRDLPEITHFVAGLGTGGTLTGTGRRLKHDKPNVQVVAAEPNPGDAVQGLRSLDEGFIPPVLDPTVLDRKILVTSDDALVMTRRLASQEGVFAGISSGAVLHAALRVARTLERGDLVCLFADGGWKYLSLGVWSKSLDEARETVRGKVWW